MKKTDSQIQQAVLNELRWDTSLLETGIGVAVSGGIVTLTGDVGSWAKRLAAQEAAHRVAGVLDVANDIEVRDPSGDGQKTDAEIARAVRHALEWDVLVPDQHIRSTVTHGWVTLEGDIPFWSQREAAAGCIRNLNGIRGVSNDIVVAPQRVSPDTLRKSIEGALERRATREARQIVLDVHEDRVTLSGVVRSWAERKAVAGAVRGTHGVRAVEDNLRIEPYST